MRGDWDLKDWELTYWTPKIKNDIETLMRSDNIDEIDYVERNLNPYQVARILEALGWESDEFETNGWEQDRWEYFFNPEYDVELCLYSCGLTFELRLSRKDDYC